MKLTNMSHKGMAMRSLMALSASAFLFTSCSSHDEPLNPESNDGLTEIRLVSNVLTGSSAEWGAQSRAASTYTAVTSAYATINDHTNNNQLYDQSLSSNTAGLLVGNTSMFYPMSGNNVDIYLYNGGSYSVDTNTNDGKIKGGSKLNVSAQTDQTTIENQTASDFIFGQKINQARTSSNVMVDMYHMMSQFGVTLTVEDGTQTQFQNIKITKIELTDLATTATYTINSENIAKTMEAGSTTSNITLFENTNGVALKDWNSTKGSELCAILVPQSVAGKTLKITTDQTNSDQTAKTFVYTFGNGASFDQGKKQVYKITLTAMGLKVTAQVLDWDVQADVTGEAGYDVPSTAE